MSRPLFLYCQNDSLKNVSALERLIMAVEPDSVSATTTFGNILVYSALILPALRSVEPGSLADSYATQVLGYIDTELLERIASDPANAMGNEDMVEDVNELAIELLHCGAALGVVGDIMPYTIEELTNIANNTTAEFSYAILAVTIGYAIMNGDKAYGPVLIRLLTSNKDEELETSYEWIYAFILGLLIHGAWSYFSEASDHEQQIILQRYFYYGIVMGVPVQSWLNVAFKTNSKLMSHLLMQKLSSSQEVIPQDTTLSKGIDFASVIRDYISALSQNSIPTLAAEKFLSGWYGTDTASNHYRAWLRSALATVYRLQTRNL